MSAQKPTAARSFCGLCGEEILGAAARTEVDIPCHPSCVKLTAAQRRALWRFYYASMFCFDGNQPPRPTETEWLTIQRAMKQRVDHAMVEALKSKGVIHVVKGTLRITDAGRAALNDGGS